MQLAGDPPALLILNSHQISGKLAKVFLRLLALSDIAIDLQHYGITLIFFLQRPAAVYNPFLAVTANVDEFTSQRPVRNNCSLISSKGTGYWLCKSSGTDFPNASPLVQPYISSAPRFQK